MSESPAATDTARLLLDAARALGETLDPHRVYERFRELVADPIPHEGLLVSSYDPAEGLIRCDYAWVDGELLDPAILPPMPFQANGGGMQSEVIRTGEPFRTNEVADRVREGGTYYDVSGNGEVAPVPAGGTPATKALMMMPVKLDGQVVGVVQLHSDNGPYSSEQAELAEGLVAQLAAAVRNARLHEAAKIEAAARLRAEEERRVLETREAAARAVAAEREDAARILEALGEGIVVVGGDGRIRVWNRGAELATGIAPAQAVGCAPQDLIGGWEAVQAQVPVSTGIDPARAVTLPVEIDERELWLSFVAVAGRIGVVYAMRDRTVEHRIEEARDEFVATVSHEIRTPLTAVLGAATTLLRTDLPLTEAQRLELLEMIARQATRLSGVTDEVLLASRLDRDEVQLETERVRVEEVVRGTIDAVAASVPLGLSLTARLGDAGEALGDRDRLQQVLVNLIDNAVKYSPDGGAIVVSTARGPGTVRIAVADDGIGIAPADRDRVFEKYYRVDATLTRGPSGTGLGLYICRGLVERMGGRLSLRSTPGKGSTFTLDLPAA